MKRYILSFLLLPVLGCGGGKPKVTPVAQAPEEQDAAVVAARDSERNRLRASASNTILTSSKGASGQATTAVKSLLGL
jgi:hypothetical protein